MIFGAETHLGSGAFFFFAETRYCSSITLQCLLAVVQLSGKAHNDSDYTAMSAIFTDAYVPELTLVAKSVSTVIILCLLLAAIARSIRTAWSLHVMCIN